MKLPSRLVWVDIETTGLDPEKDLILELGIVVTDASLREDFAGSYVIRPRNGLPALHPTVLEMHSKNGLLGELHDGRDAAIVDTVAAATVIACGAKGGPICGASAHFDQGFLKKQMPLLAACFNHRVFDTSTLKLGELLRTGAVEDDGHDPVHRALDDVRDSIQVARKLLGLAVAS